jgi:predicted RNA-binding protein with PIN domain
MSNLRHLIVDGANIMNAWPELRRLVVRDRAAARTELTRRLIPIHDSGEARVTVVFDGRAEELVIERPFTETTFSVVYTPSSLTADDVIEQMVGNSADPSACVVATNDRAERETVSALKAASLRSDELAAWIDRASLRQSSKVRELRKANARAWKQS